jgi:NAD-dependent dihydropyrimidine dehydrogenase PreA subunit
MIFVDEDNCTGCGDCLQVCPQEGAIVFQQAKAVINHDLCTGCAACMSACPEEAIYEVEAAPMLAEQAQPAQVTEQSTLSRARPAIVSTLAAAGPLAVDAIVGLARRWLDERSVARRTGGQTESGRGGRQRRRRTRGRR